MNSMKTVLESESARCEPGGAHLRAAAARCLKNVCQHGVGKIAAFEMGALASLTPLRRSRDTDVRLQAEGRCFASPWISSVRPRWRRRRRCSTSRRCSETKARRLPKTRCASCSNARAAPDARRRMRDALGEREKALVFDERVVGNCVVSF